MRYLIVLAFLAPVAHAQAWEKTKQTARAAAKTGADAVVDSARTVGETAKGLWDGGKPEAKRAYDANASRARRDMHEDAAETRAAAHGAHDARDDSR